MIIHFFCFHWHELELLQCEPDTFNWSIITLDFSCIWLIFLQWTSSISALKGLKHFDLLVYVIAPNSIIVHHLWRLLRELDVFNWSIIALAFSCILLDFLRWTMSRLDFKLGLLKSLLLWHLFKNLVYN